MEIVNQLAGSLAQSAEVSRQQSANKSLQIRRAQVLRKDVATTTDEFAHRVESTGRLTPVHDEQKQPDHRPRHKASRPACAAESDPESDLHIDVTG